MEADRHDGNNIEQHINENKLTKTPRFRATEKFAFLIIHV